jgi:pimeloyl-ACP methyl ester carboxylesterase
MSPVETAFCHAGAHCTEQMVQVDEHAKLRVLSYTPAFPSGNNTIVFVGGLSTVLDSFKYVVRELTRDFALHYIETRDRPTSQLNGESRFDCITFGFDVASVINSLGLTEGKYVLIGYSFGAPVLIDCYHILKKKPEQMVFVEPTPALHYPKWSLRLLKASLIFKKNPLKPFANWYIRNFVIDKKADAEMVNISARAINSSDPAKLIKTILAIADYNVWDKLETIECPVLILGATKDKLHAHDEIRKLVSLLKNCRYVDMEDNQRSHSAEVAELVRGYIKSTTTHKPS